MRGCIRTTVHHASIASATSTPAEDRQTVATLRADELLDGLFACTRKDRQISRAGTPYLNIELRDSTGTILARVFRDADLLGGRFERGDVVRVRGRVGRFREQPQVEVHSIERADGEAEPERFLPSAYRDLDELEGFLEHLVREVYDAPLKALLQALIGDRELLAQIRRAPCSPPLPLGAARPGASSRAPAGHHAYLGGLLEHTVAVATLALELCTLHPRLDRDLLLSAAIVHDLGKTREFTYGADVQRSAEGRLLGHVELGLRVIAAHAPGALAGERRLALEHCVIVHHGADMAAGQRFGSPEAFALYRLNALDASLKGALEHGMPGFVT
jgi:3'-5' exoribonuclease